MRPFLIVLCLLALAATGWIAVFKGTERPHLRGAPQIAAAIDRDVRAAVAAATGRPVEVVADGRTVTLTGTLGSKAERDGVVAAVRGVALVSRLDGKLEVQRVASPYTLTVEKAPGGALALSGFVPSDSDRDRLLTAVLEAAPDAALSEELEIIAGVPEGDWPGMVGAGLGGLFVLSHGRLTLSDATGHLAGEAPDLAARAAAIAAISEAPMGTWTHEIEVPAPEGGFRFAAMKGPDGAIVLDGHAPDAQTREALMQAAAAVSSEEIGGDLTIAPGMPDAAWPDRVLAGLRALDAAASGFLNVDADGVSLIVEVDGDEDIPALEARLEEGWQAQIRVLNPTPVGDVVITLAEDGSLTAAGLLPAGLEPGRLTAALPGADVSAIQTDKRGRPDDWGAALDGLSIVLPRFVAARVRLAGTSLAIDGTLARGYSTEGVEASLRTVIGRDWTLNLKLAARAPLAEVVLSKRGAEISLSGVLPDDLSPDEALRLLGDTAGGEGLTGGGDGDPAAWRTAVAASARALGFFDVVSGRIAGQRIELDGELRSGYTAGGVRDWLAARLAEGWQADLTATEATPGEGDRRTNLATGKTEIYRGGTWLEEMDFPTSPDGCGAATDAALEGGSVGFVPGSPRFDEAAPALLARLAAVSVRCLNDASMHLEIVGHTASIGNDAANLRLSEARAAAVMAALVERGVGAEAMSATGLGEAEPVATNNTPEGRAANNRIAFRWSERDDQLNREGKGTDR